MADSPAVADLRTKLERHLRELAAEVMTDPDGDFVIPQGSTLTFVRPLDWRDGKTVVRVWAVTNTGLGHAGPELAKYLVTENAKLVFGGFALDREKGLVGFGQTLLGDYLQRKELETAIGAVASTADEYDDKIKARFGGRLFTEG